MNITEILKQHQQLLDKAKASLSPKDAPIKDLALPVEVRQRRIEEITKRIQDLGQQKDASVRKYDAAIAQHKAELARLQGGVARGERLMKAATASPEELIKELQAAADKNATPTKPTRKES